MKRKILFLVSIFSFIACFCQEKTFNVLVHDRTHLETRTEYAKKVLFPVKDKKIKEIMLDFSLNCPDKKCSDWDYSINIVLRTLKNGNTENFQLGRMITPYSGWYNQGENAKKWDYHLKWNVTEYLPLMKDSVEIVISYEGYQDGFLASADFIFTEYGPKEKTSEFIDVENVYFGYYPFGREDSTIDEFLKEKVVSIPKGTKNVLARMTVSGHGGDGLNAAAEFLKKNFRYKVNGIEAANQSVWRDDCGCNPVQPQGGTWIYNRAGWCPGTKVNEYYYDLTPYIKDNKLAIELNFDYYNGHGSGDAGYQIANDLFFVKDKDYQHKEVSEERNFVLNPISLPEEFILVFKTNNDARDKWYLADTNKLYEQSQFEPNTVYAHKIKLNEGNYMLKVEDTDCDGLSWWADEEQGNGYILIYDKDSSNLLEAFEPDFGCFIQQPIVVNNSDRDFQHKENKLITLQDNGKNELRIIFFCKNNNKDRLELTIKNRKTGQEIVNETFDSKTLHDIKIDCKDFESGYYAAKISCNGLSEYRMFKKKD
ncbi:MAG: hypothetical protein IJ748_00235 [Bacteroidales bacterium]|nr:hypothetical protein [Bacteroidales bacterium]